MSFCINLTPSAPFNNVHFVYVNVFVTFFTCFAKYYLYYLCKIKKMTTDRIWNILFSHMKFGILIYLFFVYFCYLLFWETCHQMHLDLCIVIRLMIFFLNNGKKMGEINFH
jgi:hypothetical protein